MLALNFPLLFRGALGIAFLSRSLVGMPSWKGNDNQPLLAASAQGR